MGNSLLDFVMAVVRDPQTAARFAADPTAALADANLAGVTIADVNNLIPVVADSLSMSMPGFGVVSRVDPAAEVENVWTSGAAAVAFDAFDIARTEPERYPAPDARVREPVSGRDETQRPGDRRPDQLPADVGPAPALEEGSAAGHADFPGAGVWTDHEPWHDPHPDPLPDRHSGDLGFEQI